MKVTDVLKDIPKASLKKIDNLLVRELDEESKGMFVSYVDDKDSTFDVRLEISRNTILVHECDCDEVAAYCLHKLAVLKAIKTPKKRVGEVKKTARVKKMSDVEILMMDLDKEAMTTWLHRIFKVHKDLELQFLLDFAKQEVKYSKEDVKLMIEEAIKSVVGRRKKLDAREIKKVADLVEKSLEGVREFILIHSHEDIVLDLLQTVCETIYDFETRTRHTSVRMIRVVDSFIEHTALSIIQIKEIELWERMFNKIWDKVFDEDQELFYVWDLKLLKLLSSSFNEVQKKVIANKVIDFVVNKNAAFENMQIEIRIFFLDALCKTSLFEEYRGYFKPIRYANEFNLKLLEALKNVDDSLLEEYCLMIIGENVEEKYNTPYYQLLHDLYTEKERVDRVVIYKKKLFLANRSLEDYQYLMQHDDPRAFKNFRKLLLSHLEDEFHKRKASQELFLNILNLESNYKEMLFHLDYQIPVRLFYPYLESLFTFDDKLLLSKLLIVGRYGFFGAEVHEETVDFVTKMYRKNLLLQEITKHGFGEGSFNEAIVLRLS